MEEALCRSPFHSVHGLGIVRCAAYDRRRADGSAGLRASSPEVEITMADQNNPGQFGNRSDTEQQAQKGGQESSGSFGE